MAEPKLVSMKIDKKAREKRYADSTVAADAPMYPYGLRLSLDDEALEALGVTALPAVGKSYTLTAICEVVSVSEHDSDMGSSRNVGLQITDLAIDFGKAEPDVDAGDTLYPTKKG